MLTISRGRRRADAAIDPFDRRGYRRSPVTYPSYRQGQEPPNKGRRFPAEPLRPDEVYALIAACGEDTAATRNRALITLFWRSGLRCSEALALLPKDVDLEHGRVTVLHGKGDKRRVVALDRGACAIVSLWAQERAALGLNGTQPLFCVVEGPTRGRPLHSAYVRNLFKQLADRAGIEKRVHPHGLRHTYAAYLMDRGVPIHHIRRMLGHTSIAITERYADHINPAAVVEAVRELAWPE